MKKTFKFFMCAAIVAAGFVGCSSEEVNPEKNGNGNGDPTTKGESTYATFTFNIDKSTGITRASAPASNMETGSIGDNSDYLVNNIRLLVFNASNQLEVNSSLPITGSPYQSATVRLMSGPKTILVLANEHAETTTAFTTNSFVTLNPDDPTIVPSTYNAVMGAINEFEVGGCSVVPVDSNDFVGGSTAPIFDIKRLTGTVSGGDYPFIMSNPDDGVKYTLLPGISETESKDATGTETDKATKNHFTIGVKRAVAKGVVTYDDANPTILTTIDGLGVLTGSSLKFGIDNVNRSAYLFQQGTGASIKSPHYDIPTWTIDGKRQHFYPYFYKMYNISNDLKPASTTGLTAVYFTENTKSGPMNGNITYAAIEGVFTPAAGKWASDITFDNSLKQITVVPGAAYSAVDLYAVTLKNGKLAYSNNYKFDDIYLFPTQELANKALYLLLYGTLKGNTERVYVYGTGPNDLKDPGADWTAAWTPPAEYAVYVDKYTGRKCYYRMDMGEGTLGASFTYAILRNAQYFAKITGFRTIGVNDRRKLDNNPYDRKDAITHVTATIKVLDWDQKTSSGTV